MKKTRGRFSIEPLHIKAIYWRPMHDEECFCVKERSSTIFCLPISASAFI